jgi:hypothetical protein
MLTPGDVVRASHNGYTYKCVGVYDMPIGKHAVTIYTFEAENGKRFELPKTQVEMLMRNLWTKTEAAK